MRLERVIDLILKVVGDRLVRVKRIAVMIWIAFIAIIFT